MLLVSLFLIGLLTATKPVFAQNSQYSGPALEWEKTFAGTELVWVDQTNDGGFAFYYKGTQEGGYARFEPAKLTKIDSTGNIQWIKNFSLPFPKNFIATKDGGFAYTTFENSELKVGKLDSNGNPQWNQTYSNLLEGNKLFIQTSDGGYAVFSHNDKGYHNRVHVMDLMILKIDSRGNTQWTKNLPSIDASFSLRALIQTSDGGYALTGSYGDGEGVSSVHSLVSNGTDFCLVKIASDGSLQWNRSYGGADNDDAYSLVQTEANDYVIVGNTLSFGAGSSDALMLKIDPSGNLIWAHTYGGFGSKNVETWFYKNITVKSGGEGYDCATSLVQTNDGGFAFAGTSNGQFTVWLVKTDSNGFHQWNQTFPLISASETYYSLKEVIQARDGSFVLVGSRFGTYWHSVGNYISLAFKTKPENPIPTSSQTLFLSSLSLEPITISRDGSIKPSNAPLTREGNHYKLTTDIYTPLIVKADNVELDGQNHLILGNGTLGPLNFLTGEIGLDLTNTRNVLVQNFNIQRFRYAIALDNSFNAKISQNYFVNDIIAIEGDHVTGSLITQNNFTSTISGSDGGICFTFSSNNKVTDNNFLKKGITIFNGNNEIISGNIFHVNGVSLNTCDDTLVCGNSFYDCFMTLGLYSNSSKSIVAANNFKDCTDAIIVDNQPGNLFYLNNFYNVSAPVLMNGVDVDETGKSNYILQRWDDGTIGNYYDYLTRLNPKAHQVGSSYRLDENNWDNHPLNAPVAAESQQALSKQLVAEHTSFFETLGLGSSSVWSQIILLSLLVIVLIVGVALFVTWKRKR